MRNSVKRLEGLYARNERLTCAALIAACAFILGAIAAQTYKPVLSYARSAGEIVGLVKPKPRVGRGEDSVQKNPLRTTCPAKSERVAVLLIGGQSNAANYGIGDKIDDDPRIVNFFNGQCYVARDPLLGATGPGRSAWILVAKKLLQSGLYDHIVILTTAVGGSGANEWAPGGSLHERLVNNIVRIKAAGLSPTHFLWHQGERDARLDTDPERYAEQVRDVIFSVRSGAGSDIPAFIALASLCQSRGPHEAIREAQRAIAAKMPSTFIAIDSDKIGWAHRYDGCHFDSSGLQLLADGYAKEIINPD